MYIHSFLLLSFATQLLAGPNAASHLVPSMPGWDVFTQFEMYSGYLEIEGTTKELHYVLVTSENDPANDPVIVWYNGGPGCSSMEGFATEHGPYILENGATGFHYNPYSWNTFANVLYIEMPAGVGYSVC